MSKISEFAAAQTAHNDKVEAAVAGVATDVTWLKDEITRLNNTPGDITREDQEILNGLLARSEAVVQKLEALDALTPPAVPPG